MIFKEGNDPVDDTLQGNGNSEFSNNNCMIYNIKGLRKINQETSSVTITFQKFGDVVH